MGQMRSLMTRQWAWLTEVARTEVARTNEKEILVHACLDLYFDGVLG
jgi:hypothetical protein